MLSYPNKIFTKLISLILAQIFLLTCVACPEVISSKDTSGVYIKDNILRVPIDSTNGYKRMQDVLNTGVHGQFLKENKGWQSRPEYAKYLLDVRKKILGLRGAAIDIKVYYYAIGGGFSGPGSGVEDIDIVSPLIAADFTELIGADDKLGDFEIFKRRIKKDLSSLQGIDLEGISFGRGVENIGGISYPVFTANFPYLEKSRKIKVYYKLDAAQVYPDELKRGYDILYSRGNPGLIRKMSKAVKSGLINNLVRNNSFIVMENLSNSDLSFDGFEKVSLGNVSWAGVRKLDFYTNISRNPADKKSMSRRTFIKDAAIVATVAFAGKLIYESGEPSDAEKQGAVYLEKPIHGERYTSKEQFEKEKKDFISSRTSKENILGSEDTARVKGFLNPERIQAIQFAADKWQLEPAFIAGFLYEENANTNSLNTIKESIKEFISRVAGFYDMKNTVGLGNVSASFIQNREFLDFLYDNRDFIMNQLLKTKADKAIFKEFTDGTEETEGYGFIKDIPENGGGWKAWLETTYGTLNSLANDAEPINILLAAYAMRVKTKEIAVRNKNEAGIPDASIMNKDSSLWIVEKYKEIPDALQSRYSNAFNSSYYPPYAYQYFLAADYTGVRALTERAVAKVKACIMFSKSGVFTASKAAHFSLRSKDNSLTSKAGLNTTERFKIGRKEYDINDADIMNKIEINTDKLGTIGPESGLNVTFTIRGPTAKAGLADYLRNNASILQEAISRSESLHNGTLNLDITVLLADKYDYLAGDHKANNLIILNASDLEDMLNKNNDPVFISELITSLLSEELAHERGADGALDTETALALNTGYNTKSVLKSIPDSGALSEYIKFVEKFCVGLKNEPGYLNYLKAFNRYQDFSWTSKHAPLVEDRTAVIWQMEMGLSKALLENLYKKLISERGYSKQAAELEVGELAKLTMAGGLGNIKRDLTESWAEKGADLISINILYGKWIKGVGYVEEDSVNHLIETMGSPEKEFEIELFDKNNVRQRIKTKVYIYRDPFSSFPNYWIYCPEVFDGAYPEGREHLAQQILLYRKAGLKLLEELKASGKVKDKLLFSLSEVYTALSVPNAVKDEFKDSPVFKDVYLHHYNHTVVPAGMPRLPASLYDFIGLNTERYGSSIVEGDKIVLARIIGREADEITGCSMLHTDILRKEVMEDFKDKIPDNISKENSEGAYLDNWQGEDIQKVIAKYYVALGARDDAGLFKILDNSFELRSTFIAGLEDAIKKQKDQSIAWFNKEGVNLSWDSALISLTRRIVNYKRLDIVVEMLKNPEYRARFMELDISIIVGGRKFDVGDQGFGATQIRTLEKLIEKYPELRNNVAIVSEDSNHAGYNIFIAPKIYNAVDATIMLSDRGQEAGPTTPSKVLVNAGAIIATLDGIIPEVLVPFNRDTLEGNGFKVAYSEEGAPSVESLFKALEDFNAIYKNKEFHRNLIYNSLKTGMLQGNISATQGPGLIMFWQEGLERKNNALEQMLYPAQFSARQSL